MHVAGLQTVYFQLSLLKKIETTDQPTKRAVIAYTDAIASNIPGAEVITVKVDTFEGIVTTAIVVQVPDELYCDAKRLIGLEERVHAAVEQSDPSLVGLVAFRYEPGVSEAA